MTRKWTGGATSADVSASESAVRSAKAGVASANMDLGLARSNSSGAPRADLNTLTRLLADHDHVEALRVWKAAEIRARANEKALRACRNPATELSQQRRNALNEAQTLVLRAKATARETALRVFEGREPLRFDKLLGTDELDKAGQLTRLVDVPAHEARLARCEEALRVAESELAQVQAAHPTYADLDRWTRFLGAKVLRAIDGGAIGSRIRREEPGGQVLEILREANLTEFQEHLGTVAKGIVWDVLDHARTEFPAAGLRQDGESDFTDRVDFVAMRQAFDAFELGSLQTSVLAALRALDECRKAGGTGQPSYPITTTDGGVVYQIKGTRSALDYFLQGVRRALHLPARPSPPRLAGGELPAVWTQGRWESDPAVPPAVLGPPTFEAIAQTAVDAGRGTG